MRRYEVMIILDPTLDDARWPRHWSSSSSVCATRAAPLGEGRRAGKRRLAYDIGKNSEGIYAVIDLTAKPSRSTSSTAAQPDRGCAATKVLRPDFTEFSLGLTNSPV